MEIGQLSLAFASQPQPKFMNFPFREETEPRVLLSSAVKTATQLTKPSRRKPAPRANLRRVLC